MGSTFVFEIIYWPQVSVVRSKQAPEMQQGRGTTRTVINGSESLMLTGSRKRKKFIIRKCRKLLKDSEESEYRTNKQ